MTNTQRGFATGLKVAFISAAACLSLPALAASGIDPKAYPSYDDRQLGQMRYFVDLARAPLETWDFRSYPNGETDLRYNVGHMSNALAVAQYGITPAYRELVREAQDHLIEKMTDARVWNYWYPLSRLADGFDPNTETVTPWRDPIKKKNIMYSAYLFQMVSNYRVLYNDAKYDTPGSLTLKYSYRPYGTNKTDSFVYDANSLAKVLYDQFAEGNFHGIECQPNYIFAPCNAFPRAAFLHHDFAHGTHYAKQVIDGMRTYWAGLGKETKGDPYMIRISTGEAKGLPMGMADSASGTFGHIWDRAAVEAAYPAHRDYEVPILTTKMPWTMRQEGTSAAFGGFSAYAAEMGDKKTVAEMIAFADKNLKPTWDKGRFYYPANYIDDANAYPAGNQFGVEMLGTVFLGQAILNRGGVWAELYNHPWDKAFFAQPYIGGISYPDVQVTQAIYDKRKSALIVGLQPGTDKQAPAHVEVYNLDPGKSYRIEMDGQDVGTVSGGKAKISEGKAAWSADKVLALDIDLTKPRSLIIYKH